MKLPSKKDRESLTKTLGIHFWTNPVPAPRVPTSDDAETLGFRNSTERNQQIRTCEKRVLER